MATELVTIYYNGHFTQMCYPDQVDEQLAKWGLPAESIEVMQYPAGSIVAPFSVGTAKELYILKEELPPPSTEEPPVQYSFKVALREILLTPEGKKFLKLIRVNNEKLKDVGLQLVPEPLAEEVQEPKYYSITATVTPVVL